MEIQTYVMYRFTHTNIYSKDLFTLNIYSWERSTGRMF